MHKNAKAHKRSSVSSDTSSYVSLSISTSNNKSRSKKHKEISGSSSDISSEIHGSSRKSVARKKNKNKRSRNGSVGLVKKDQKEKNTNPKEISIDYNEPPEAKEPKKKWLLCPVKYDESCPTHEKSVYLIGRLRKVVDIPISHPTCSKQHAALQYRLVKLKKNDGTFTNVVRPYLIDLDSVNGTYVNNKKIESRKYMELHEKDIIKFGNSSVQYVLLQENNNNSDDDDDFYGVENISVKKELN
ncbi:hypothetical protein RN001_005097 [Aquatica leii]|uniref:FHA domain-containing protein n=1 Tax=Aquatica leii TaxID=1421715 RepID=A0AAN7QJZ7_9COLE|nr:hypothetical protein RN001_005097 [Aquatica leii]